jgi:hypothetical protein
MKPFFGRASRELREIVSREEPAFAIEHRNLQFVAVVPDEIDLACEIVEIPRVLILEPQPENFDFCGGAIHRLLHVTKFGGCWDNTLCFCRERAEMEPGR